MLRSITSFLSIGFIGLALLFSQITLGGRVEDIKEYLIEPKGQNIHNKARFVRKKFHARFKIGSDGNIKILKPSRKRSGKYSWRSLKPQDLKFSHTAGSDSCPNGFKSREDFENQFFYLLAANRISVNGSMDPYEFLLQYYEPLSGDKKWERHRISITRLTNNYVSKNEKNNENELNKNSDQELQSKSKFISFYENNNKKFTKIDDKLTNNYVSKNGENNENELNANSDQELQSKSKFIPLDSTNNFFKGINGKILDFNKKLRIEKPSTQKTTKGEILNNIEQLQIINKENINNNKCGQKYQIGFITNKNEVKPSSSPVPAQRITEDAEVIVQEGVFTQGCDPETSLSDHAPVIAAEKSGLKLMSWNIANKASGKPSSGGFYYHKFKSKSGRVYNEDDDAYSRRLTKIANEINKLFSSHYQTGPLNTAVLQEVPLSFGGGIKERKILWEAFSSRNLKIDFSENNTQAFVTKVRDKDFAAVENLPQAIIDNGKNHHRFMLRCSVTQNTCIVNVHAKWRDPKYPDEEPNICTYIDNIKTEILNNKKLIKKIIFAGDFNESGEDLIKNCDKIQDLKNQLTISTPPGKGQSCSDNNGGHNPKSVDFFATLNL